jgi:hypothetical protein
MKSAEKRKPEQLLDVNQIIERLDYNPDSGEFRWKVKTKTGQIGGIAGNVNHRGYRSIWIDGLQFYAHRLAWLISFGEWPDVDIDHINENKSDNRISNLRKATRSENMFNRKANKNNTSGVKGVSFCRQTKRWVAQITVNRKNIKLGRFDTIEEAANIYSEKAKQFRGEFAKC